MSNTQMQDDWTGTGYDAKASKDGGIYLRLKDKGQKVRLRLVTECYRFWDTIKEENGEEKPIRKCAWIAIHKEVSDGKPTKKVVVFQAGPMVYGLIKDLADSEGWGNPTTFDVEITRTEEKGRYYTVLALPKPIGPISAEEQALVTEANIDLHAACSGRKDGGTGTGGTSGNAPAPGEFDPFADD